MHIKSRLRKVLWETLVANGPQSSTKNSPNGPSRSFMAKKLINNVRLQESQKQGSTGGFVRVLAPNLERANRIVDILKNHQQELPIKSVRVIDEAIDHWSRENTYTHSVVVEMDPKVLLQSAVSTFNNVKAKVLEIENIIGDNSGLKSERIVIDFSSPNIAKPFHFGHLKSTILGNFLANLNSFLGHKVTKLNYIGDWGTQFGLLSLGLDKYGPDSTTDPDSKPSTLRQLAEIYVRASKQSQLDETFYSAAKERVVAMQKYLLNSTGSEHASKWREIRRITLEELKISYEQLGIEFDEFEFESNIEAKAIQLAKTLESNGIATVRGKDGPLSVNLELNDKMVEIPFLKSDGTSLYLTRDVASAIERKEKYQFDKMLYVVGANQERHLRCVSKVIEKLHYDWADSLIHVKMGKVKGMSTRHGDCVLLSDIITEATYKYKEETFGTPTSKVKSEGEVSVVAKNLALSALFVYDMRRARTRDYSFDWKSVLESTDSSGIQLQTSLARLHSLIERCGANGLKPYNEQSATELNRLNPEAISCAEGLDLLSVLDELDTKMHDSYENKDSSALVNHALTLSKAANRARKCSKLSVLREKNTDLARTRLTLFNSSYVQLRFMIQLFGLTPLNRV